MWSGPFLVILPVSKMPFPCFICWIKALLRTALLQFTIPMLELIMILNRQGRTFIVTVHTRYLPSHQVNYSFWLEPPILKDIRMDFQPTTFCHFPCRKDEWDLKVGQHEFEENGIVSNLYHTQRLSTRKLLYSQKTMSENIACQYRFRGSSIRCWILCWLTLRKNEF